jgi:hypothetical protein
MGKNGSVNSAILVLQHCSQVALPNVNVFIAHFSYIACDQPERVFFKVEARASMSEDRLEATLFLIKTRRDKTLAIDAVTDSFAIKTISSSRRFILSACLNCDLSLIRESCHVRFDTIRQDSNSIQVFDQKINMLILSNCRIEL